MNTVGVPGVACPYCQSVMQTREMACRHCQIAVRAEFPMLPLTSLPLEHQRFIELFVLSSGNLKEIASLAGVSYPTVRNRLDKVIDALRQAMAASADRPPETTGGAGSSDSLPETGHPARTEGVHHDPAEIIKRLY